MNTRYNRYAKMVYATASDVPEDVTDAIIVSSGELTYLLERNSFGELLDFDALGYIPFVQDLPDTLEIITNRTFIDIVPNYVVVDGNEHIFYGDIVANDSYVIA